MQTRPVGSVPLETPDNRFCPSSESSGVVGDSAIQLWELLSLQDKHVGRLNLAAPFWAKILEETHMGLGLDRPHLPGKLPTESNHPVETE